MALSLPPLANDDAPHSHPLAAGKGSGKGGVLVVGRAVEKPDLTFRCLQANYDS